MIIVCIIKVSAGDTINGQVDTTWVVFWYVVEAAGAVVMVSVTAFRSLFTADTPGYKLSSQSARHWLSRMRALAGRRTAHAQVESEPSSPTTYVRTSIHQNSFDEEKSTGSGEMSIPIQGIRVTHDMFTIHTVSKHLPISDSTGLMSSEDHSSKIVRPSCESIV